MASITFPNYSRLDGLNSLVTKCVHTLCFPANESLPKASQLPSLYDFNLLPNNKKRVNSKVPCRLLELFYSKFHESSSYRTGEKRSLLDVHSRQFIVDYIIRERILVSANFVIQLLQDGGVYNFDLWQLCELNEFTSQEAEQILLQMCSCAHVFRNLTLGGSSWIYNFLIVRGALKKFLSNSSLCNLNALKIQQLSYETFHPLLHSCAQLERLEIAQPLLSNRDILKMSTYLASNSLTICQTLRNLMLPSSVKEEGLLHLLANFPKLTHIRCTPFEQLLDLLDLSLVNLSPTQYLAQGATTALNNLRSLTIDHPMSSDMMERLLRVCPQIEELSLQVQEGMNLSLLATQAPKLSKLALYNSPSLPLNYLEHVVPLLEVAGQRLTSLSLEYFEHIDLTTCAQHCPNLRAFTAQWFSTVTLQHRLYRLLMIKKPFCNLRYLRLRPRPHQSLSAEITSFLLNDATQLRHIELYCCSELTDDTIFAINKLNPLQFLQTFILRHGHNVTNDALFKLVSRASANDSLVFHDCGLVPPARKEEM